MSQNLVAQQVGEIVPDFEVVREKAHKARFFEDLMGDLFEVKYAIYQSFFFNPWYKWPNENQHHLLSILQKVGDVYPELKNMDEAISGYHNLTKSLILSTSIGQLHLLHREIFNQYSTIRYNDAGKPIRSPECSPLETSFTTERNLADFESYLKHELINEKTQISDEMLQRSQEVILNLKQLKQIQEQKYEIYCLLDSMDVDRLPEDLLKEIADDIDPYFAHLPPREVRVFWIFCTINVQLLDQLLSCLRSGNSTAGLSSDDLILDSNTDNLSAEFEATNKIKTEIKSLKKRILLKINQDRTISNKMLIDGYLQEFENSYLCKGMILQHVRAVKGEHGIRKSRIKREVIANQVLVQQTQSDTRQLISENSSAEIIDVTPREEKIRKRILDYFGLSSRTLVHKIGLNDLKVSKDKLYWICTDIDKRGLKNYYKIKKEMIGKDIGIKTVYAAILSMILDKITHQYKCSLSDNERDYLEHQFNDLCEIESSLSPKKDQKRLQLSDQVMDIESIEDKTKMLSIETNTFEDLFNKINAQMEGKCDGRLLRQTYDIYQKEGVGSLQSISPGSLLRPYADVLLKYIGEDMDGFPGQKMSHLELVYNNDTKIVSIDGRVEDDPLLSLFVNNDIFPVIKTTETYIQWFKSKLKKRNPVYNFDKKMDLMIRTMQGSNTGVEWSKIFRADAVSVNSFVKQVCVAVENHCREHKLQGFYTHKFRPSFLNQIKSILDTVNLPDKDSIICVWNHKKK